MFKKLRLKLAKLVPFLKWIANDIEKGDVTSAKSKVETEIKETLGELKADK